MAGIFSGVGAVGKSKGIFGALPAHGDDRAVYIGAASDVTDSELEQDDVNTMSAALTQAATTGQSVTVTLTDGSHFTANPDGSTNIDGGSGSSGGGGSAKAASALPAARDKAKVPAPSNLPMILGVAGLIAVGAGVVIIRRKKKARKNPRRKGRRSRR